jgi:protein-S-isoprenylcysteine O-methyltransferase Ste14
LLIAFGAIINIWADFLIKKKKTTVKPYENPTQLITSGPFRISRNPQYLGFTAILLGVAINHGSITVFVAPVLFAILMNQMFIPFEEKNLEKTFGKRYINYKKKVRRWV